MAVCLEERGAAIAATQKKGEKGEEYY